MKNLNDLTAILFETLEGVVNNSTDPKKAQAVVGISNSIINSGKLQLMAYKMAKTEEAPHIFGIPESDPVNHPEEKDTSEEIRAIEKRAVEIKLSEKSVKPKPMKLSSNEKNKYTQMSSFANDRGYKSVSDGMAKMGKPKFMECFSEWMNAETL